MPVGTTHYEQDGFIIDAATTGSGTGNYLSFLRVQANGSETGYNTDVNAQLDNKDGPWTHDLLISDLATITVDGHDYYEVRLDLNEAKNGDERFITLTELQFYVGGAAGASPTQFAGLTKIFDLTGSLVLEDSNHGSGTDDYHILIPAELLDGVGPYLTLAASFSGTNDGFEEFRALADTDVFVPTPDIGILKTTNNVDDNCPDILVGGTVTWRYEVENNGNVDLHNVVVTDDNGTPGDTTDDFQPEMVLGMDGIHNVGDVNNNNILETTETWEYIETGTALHEHYINVATVSGVYDDGTLAGQTVTAQEEDCYDGAAPSIAVQKLTNGHDDECNYIIVGDAITWTYNVTNTSDTGIYIDAITLTDDAGTPMVTGDDFNPVAVTFGGHNVGDSNGNDVLDIGETWQYSFSAPLGAVAGEYFNTVTVEGTAHDAYSNTAPVENTGTDCYFGAAPDIDIVKLTNGTDDLCPVVHVGETVTWTYNVTNSGNVALDNIQLYDDGGTPDVLPGGELNDIVPTQVLSGGFNVGDTSMDGIFDPGETWVYQASGIAQEGHYDNVAYVSGDFTDDFGHLVTVTADEDDCYVGVEGPGVRTPGFWSNPKNGGQFWNGTIHDEKHAGEDCFPFGELTRTDFNQDGKIDDADGEHYIMQGGEKGILIGDWNMNGVEDGTEDTIFISLRAANILINASQKDQQDGRFVVGRDVVATWLNYLAGNPIGTIDNSDNLYSPKEAIADAVNFLQQFGDTADNGIFTNSNGKSISWEGSPVKQGTANWGTIGSPIHNALDEYNNFGTVNGTGYAHTCEHDQFVSMMSGFQTDQGLFMM